MSMNEEKYNGWTNYETWAAYIWMTSEEGTYKAWTQEARAAKEEAGDKLAARGILAERMQEAIEENAPDLPASLYSDLLGRAIGRIDFLEVAAAFLEE